MEIHRFDLHTTLGNHICRNRTVDTAGKKRHTLTVRADRKSARSRNDLGINIGDISHFHVDEYIRFMNVDRHIWIGIQKIGSKITV